MSYDRMGKRNMQFVAGFTGIAGLLFHAPLTSDLTLLAGTGSATFTRATAQSYRDTGAIKSVASGTAAFEKDGSGNDFGFASWEASTNDCLRSENFAHAAWVNTNVTVDSNDSASIIDGASADKLTAAAANAILIQDLGVIGSTQTNFAIYIKRVTGTGNIELTADNGATWTNIATEINSSTFTKVDIQQTLADPDVGIRIVTSGDAILVDAAQSEQKAFPTPYIPTTDAAATRNKTDLTYPTSGNIESADGTFHQIIRIEEFLPSVWSHFIDTREPGMIIAKQGGGAGNKLYWQSDNGLLNQKGVVAEKTTYAITFTWLADDFEGYLDGVSVGTDTTGAPATGHQTLYVGQSNAKTNPLNGNIKDFRIYDRSLTDDEILSLV